jgi:glucose-6-phosphate 1-dehydrogenase
VDRFTVIGQYGPGKTNGKEVPGYRQEKGFHPIPTRHFFAGPLHRQLALGGVLSMCARESGCPGGSPRLPSSSINPLKLFGRTCDVLEPNILLLTIQPEEKISLRFGVKVPGMANQIYPIDAKFSYQTFQHPFPGLRAAGPGLPEGD